MFRQRVSPNLSASNQSDGLSGDVELPSQLGGVTDASTCPAKQPSNRGDLGISQLRATIATPSRSPPATSGIRHVFKLVPESKVSRIDATRIVTSMQNELSGRRHMAVGKFPGNLGCRGQLAPPNESAIPARRTCGPYPAGIDPARTIYFRPVPLDVGSSQFKARASTALVLASTRAVGRGLARLRRIGGSTVDANSVGTASLGWHRLLHSAHRLYTTRFKLDDFERVSDLPAKAS